MYHFTAVDCRIYGLSVNDVTHLSLSICLRRCVMLARDLPTKVKVWVMGAGDDHQRVIRSHVLDSPPCRQLEFYRIDLFRDSLQKITFYL